MTRKQKQEQAIVQAVAKTAVLAQPPDTLPRQGNFMRAFADEVAKLVIKRLPGQGTPKKKTKKTPNKYVGAYILDTSAIIDGRILDVIHMGFLTGNVVTPESVLLELKHIADSKDPIKKERGRRALDALNKIKKIKGIHFAIMPEDKTIAQKYTEVDEKLIAITKSVKGKLVTCDTNLEKKAKVHGIVALNVHALAQVLKIAAVPGEQITVSVIHVGKDSSQGVGYLDDGTMIVVEKGASFVGSEIPVTISRVLQTATGKILFAKQSI